METQTIYAKLLEFQTSIDKIKKDGSNPFFKKPDGKASTYATLPNILEEVKPILNALKLVLTQPCKNGKVYSVITDSSTGEKVYSSIPLPAGLNAQQTGSAITYYRRYTLCSLLSLEIDEDDDGNIASGNTGKQEESGEEKQWLNKYTDKTKTKTTETWDKVIAAIKSKAYTLQQVESKYKLSKELKTELSQIK